MSGIQKFEDIIAWQKSQSLAVIIYKEFRNSKDFGFRDQICKAVVSVSNNIAEGFDRASKADFSRFLYFAKSSNSEVKSMIYLAESLNYIDNKKKVHLIELSDEVGKVINGLIKSISPKNLTTYN